MALTDSFLHSLTMFRRSQRVGVVLKTQTFKASKDINKIGHIWNLCISNAEITEFQEKARADAGSCTSKSPDGTSEGFSQHGNSTHIKHMHSFAPKMKKML